MGEVNGKGPDHFVYPLKEGPAQRGDTRPTRGQFDRLPQYAKYYIELLDMRLRESLKREVELTSNEQSYYRYKEHVPGVSLSERRYIPEKLMGIYIATPALPEEEINFRVSGQNTIRITGGPRFAIYPDSSNTVLLEVVPSRDYSKRIR